MITSLLMMSEVKLGDFLLLTPCLRELQRVRPGIAIAVPDMLWDLFEQTRLLENRVRASEVDFFLAERRPWPAVLNLTYPLLETHLISIDQKTLNRDPFFRHQHVTQSYAEALREHFPEMPTDFKAAPYLDLQADEAICHELGLEPFHYFTVHSGSDFAPKNWDARNFERVIELLLADHPGLQAVGLVGPQDEPLFQNRKAPTRFQSVRTDLKKVAGLMAGSLFHVDNDSGIHHLAGAMDVPSITVFGPTPPGTWSSLTSKNFIHWGGPNCFPECRGRGVMHCQERFCLSSVTPSDLVTSAKTILAHYPHLG